MGSQLWDSAPHRIFYFSFKVKGCSTVSIQSTLPATFTSFKTLLNQTWHIDVVMQYKTMFTVALTCLLLSVWSAGVKQGQSPQFSLMLSTFWPLASCSVKVPSDELGYLNACTI